MKILFYLGHPAHFHLFKNVLRCLNANGHNTVILIKKKDVLEDLLKQSSIDYLNILPRGRQDGFAGIALGLIKRIPRMFIYCAANRPDLLIGTSVEISLIGKILGIPSINVNEDDADVVPLYSILAYPLAGEILTPEPCNNGRWDDKSIKYAGYHELSYLHPDTFKPEYSKVHDYFQTNSPYFIIRFAKLTAHHDHGIQGINSHIAEKIIEILEPYGRIFITSERKLEHQFEKYRLIINPLDIHHMMYFASMYIGDSQTMAAEAGVLGTPFIRYNDFVDRIGYLRELEEKYELGYGIKPKNPGRLYNKIIDIISMVNFKKQFQDRKNRMLKEKINVCNFMVWFIENYPNSARILKDNPNYQYRFR